jgi:hypothetical protein
MQWELPSYSFVNMSAEIGAYQDDFGRTDDPPTCDRESRKSKPREPKEVDPALVTV